MSSDPATANTEITNDDNTQSQNHNGAHEQSTKQNRAPSSVMSILKKIDTKTGAEDVIKKMFWDRVVKSRTIQYVQGTYTFSTGGLAIWGQEQKLKEGEQDQTPVGLTLYGGTSEEIPTNIWSLLQGATNAKASAIAKYQRLSRIYHNVFKMAISGGESETVRRWTLGLISVMEKRQKKLAKNPIAIAVGDETVQVSEFQTAFKHGKLFDLFVPGERELVEASYIGLMTIGTEGIELLQHSQKTDSNKIGWNSTEKQLIKALPKEKLKQLGALFLAKFEEPGKQEQGEVETEPMNQDAVQQQLNQDLNLASKDADVLDIAPFENLFDDDRDVDLLGGGSKSVPKKKGVTFNLSKKDGVSPLKQLMHSNNRQNQQNQYDLIRGRVNGIATYASAVWPKDHIRVLYEAIQQNESKGPYDKNVMERTLAMLIQQNKLKWTNSQLEYAMAIIINPSLSVGDLIKLNEAVVAEATKSVVARGINPTLQTLINHNSRAGVPQHLPSPTNIALAPPPMAKHGALFHHSTEESVTERERLINLYNPRCSQRGGRIDEAKNRCQQTMHKALGLRGASDTSLNLAAIEHS